MSFEFHFFTESEDLQVQSCDRNKKRASKVIFTLPEGVNHGPYRYEKDLKDV